MSRAEPLHLGRSLDPESLEPVDADYVLDVDALTRHAVCFGATGSGKTGAAVVLIEELIRADIPVIAVDPKGDLANLALLFERLEPSSFGPFLDDPGKAEGLADLWKNGLSGWGIDEAEVGDLARKIDLQILTPGSRAAAPVDVLGALASPGVDESDSDGWVEAIRATVQALLELVGVKADPVQDPEHIVLATLLDHAWRAGEEPNLESLVVQLVDPPFNKVGAFPLKSFMPRKARLALAMKLNGLIASPSFAAWSMGTPLNIDGLLERRDGRVPVRVFYLAHLSEAERQLAATLLLTRLAAWSRKQPGSSKLKAALLFDEAWGYMPPHPRDPSTKRPLLQLLKQARAVGLGVILATQNPVDLDYKALSNAGTWLVGRLATRQDRERVLDGAEPHVHDWLDRMPKRGFWVRRPGAAEDALMTTRWAMTWLRGPLTLPEVTKLVGGGARPIEEEAETGEPAGTWLEQPSPSQGLEVRYLDPEQAHSPRLKALLAGRSIRPGASGETLWEPALLARVHVLFDERGWEAEREELRWIFPLDADDAIEPVLEDGDLFSAAPQGRFASFLADLSDASLKSRARGLIADIVRDEVHPMYKHAATKLVSHTTETREAFEARVREALEAKADVDIQKQRESVEKAVDRLEAKRRSLVEDLEQHEADARSRLTTEWVNAGETLLGMLFGGRRKSWSGMASKREQTRKANARAERTNGKIEELQREIEAAASELESKIETIRATHLAKADAIEEKMVRLEKNDVTLRGFELVWVPVTTAI